MTSQRDELRGLEPLNVASQETRHSIRERDRKHQIEDNDMSANDPNSLPLTERWAGVATHDAPPPGNNAAPPPTSLISEGTQTEPNDPEDGASVDFEASIEESDAFLASKNPQPTEPDGDGSALDCPPHSVKSNGQETDSTHPQVLIPDASTAKTTNLSSLMSFMSSTKWPDPPAPEAFYGLAGEIVKTLDPHTESDPVAVLIQIMVAFGNVVGSSPHFKAEADRHPANIFAVLTGQTAKGRKGTSWAHTRNIFESVQPQWAAERIQSGLSSGEGLIYAVRDPNPLMGDPGVADKRLLVVESEFASVLKMARREGNILSTTIRQAWDTGTLHVLTRNSPIAATGAHISIIGHITQGELTRHMDTTEMGNGFANRILWPCVRRSKLLPEGGQLEPATLQEFIIRLKDAASFAATIGEIKRDEAARALWYDIYDELSEGKPGLVGSVTSRAEAQVMRLAMIYALLDQSPVIKREHLEAALALWKYCEASVRFIWGDSLGDPAADELALELQQRPGGMTRTEIRDFFKRNKRSDQIERVLDLLSSCGLITPVIEPTSGRPTERWVATRHFSKQVLHVSNN